MKNKAIFLDRDGVINQERGEYTKSPDEFIINPGVPGALKKFSEQNFLLIVITNQSGIAKGVYSLKTLEKIHEKLFLTLEKEDVKLTEIYFCPHHPSVSKCLCRKPDSLLLEKAIARFNIDPAASFFIGDAERDVEAASKAGVRAIRITPNSPLSEIKL